MEPIKLYHGSKKLFSQLSNAYHYSGWGKMASGWGVYLSSDIDGSLHFGLGIEPLAMNMIWVADGKKLYHSLVNSTGYFDLSYEEIRRYVLRHETYHHKNWRDDLMEAMKLYFKFDTEYPEKASLMQAMMLKKLEAAKEVKLLNPGKSYIYTIEVSPRKIFNNEDAISPELQRAINQRLAAEKRRMVYPVQPFTKTYYTGIYGQLEAAFRRRYRYAKPKKNTAKLTSLFLHRMGYDLIQTNYLNDEFLLIDITKAKVVAVEKIGV